MEHVENYSIKGASFTDLKRQAEAAWKELQDPSSKLYAEARTAGVDPGLLKGPLERHIKISRAAALLDPFVTKVIVSSAGLVANSVWFRLLLPWLQYRLGIDVLVGESKARKKYAEDQTLAKLRRHSKSNAVTSRFAAVKSASEAGAKRSTTGSGARGLPKRAASKITKRNKGGR